MKLCSPDCPNILPVESNFDIMTKKTSTYVCEKYNKRLWINSIGHRLERLECCEVEFKEITVYECHFTFGTRELIVSTGDLKNTYGLEEFKDGFWINDDFKFTKESDALIWIPSSQIHYVKKIQKEVLDEEI